MKDKKVFIDTDMGNDDIMAICMLLLEPNIAITGISLINGVSGIKKGSENIEKILSFLQKNISVCSGYEKGFIEEKAQFPQRDIDRAEALTLLNGIKLPKKTNSELKSKKFVEDFILEKTSQGDTILLALGPLTNIAKCIEKFGEQFLKNLGEIIIMGGGIKRGNVAPNFVAEYNIWLDPEAAQIVFSSKIPITMVGIDATDHVQVSKTFTNTIKNINPQTKEAKIIKEIIINNDDDFNAFYDPLATNILIDKNLIIKSEICTIDVAIAGINRGKTYIKNQGVQNVRVVQEVDPKAFYKKLIDTIIGNAKTSHRHQSSF